MKSLSTGENISFAEVFTRQSKPSGIPVQMYSRREGFLIRSLELVTKNDPDIFVIFRSLIYLIYLYK